MDEELRKKLIALREIVWLEDIGSPTCPEYIEHHESIQKILKYIDEELLTIPNFEPYRGPQILNAYRDTNGSMKIDQEEEDINKCQKIEK
jgi:hypothetical protein